MSLAVLWGRNPWHFWSSGIRSRAGYTLPVICFFPSSNISLYHFSANICLYHFSASLSSSPLKAEIALTLTGPPSQKELAGWKHLSAMVLSHVYLGQEAKTAFRPELLPLLWKDYGKGSLGHASAQCLVTFTAICIIKQLMLIWQKLQNIWHIINWELPNWRVATGWRGRGSQLLA